MRNIEGIVGVISRGVAAFFLANACDGVGEQLVIKREQPRKRPETLRHVQSFLQLQEHIHAEHIAGEHAAEQLGCTQKRRTLWAID